MLQCRMKSTLINILNKVPQIKTTMKKRHFALTLEALGKLNKMIITSQ